MRFYGLRGIPNPDKLRISTAYIKRAHEVFGDVRRYSNYLKSILPFVNYSGKDFIQNYVNADKLDRMVFSDIIKDCQYPLD